MAYSIWDKQPELVLPKVPFEFLAGLAEKQDKQMDELDTRLGKIKGEFASLVAAPGHEDLATGLTSDYNKRVDDWYEKHKNSLTSREASRELTSLGTQFANDQKVQTVVKSRQFYEKFEPKMWEELNKRSYVDAPGILNPDGTFNQNSQMYDMSKFHLTSQADYIKSIQEQYKIKKEAKFASSETKPIGTDAAGNLIYKTEDVQKIWNDPANRKETALAIEEMVWDNTTTDPGLIYLKATAERLNPNDLEAQKKYVRESIKRAGVPFDFDWEDTKTVEKIDEANKKSGGGSKTPDAAALGVLTTVSLKNLEDPTTGQPITSAQGLETAIKTLDAGITTIKGGIIDQFPAIAELEKAGGKPFYTDTKLGFEVIDINKVAEKAGIKNDPIAMAQLNEKNIELINAQVRKNGYYEKQAELMEAAGLNASKTLDEQVAPNLKVAAHQEAVYQNDNLLTNPPTIWGYPDPLDSRYVEKSINRLTGATTDISRSLLTGKPIRSKKDFEEHFEAYYKQFSESKDPKIVTEFNRKKDLLLKQRDNFLNSYTAVKDEYYRENDSRYKTYAELVEDDLNKSTNQQAFNYQLSGEAYNALKNAAILAASQGTFDRAKWDEESPRFKDMGDDGEKAKEKILPQNVSGDADLKNLWDDAKYSIRYDNDDKRWVVDAVTSKGVFEIPDVAGIAGMAEKIDPTLSNQYLSQQQNFFSQMDASNGRYAAISSPNPAANTNDYVIVKATTENHGDIKQGSYVFMLPEFKDKVFEVPTFYDFNKFMEYYNSQKGLPAEKMAQTLASRKGSTSIEATSINFNTYDSKYSGVGSKYFPTPASRGYSVKK